MCFLLSFDVMSLCGILFWGVLVKRPADLIADWMAKNKDTSVRRLLDLWLSNGASGWVVLAVFKVNSGKPG